MHSRNTYRDKNICCWPVNAPEQRLEEGREEDQELRNDDDPEELRCAAGTVLVFVVLLTFLLKNNLKEKFRV